MQLTNHNFYAKKKPTTIVDALLCICIFISVNDIVLIPFGISWLKTILLFLLFVEFLVNPRVKKLYFVTYLILAPMWFITSFYITNFLGNNLSFAIDELQALLVVILLPLIVINRINKNPKNLALFAATFLWAILIATMHKIFFVFYEHKIFTNSLLQFLYADLQGRGLVGGVYRLNTGNQLLVSLALFIAISFLIKREKTFFMGVVAIFCVVNIYLTASIFFSIATFIIIIALFINVIKKNLVVLMLLFAVTLPILYVLTEDVLTSREAATVGFDAGLYRIQQNVFLFNSFLEAPVFGKGPGYINPTNFSDTPWAFENNVLVLFAKYGVIGFLLFVSFIVLQYKMLNCRKSLLQYSIVVAFIFAASIFNPYLFGTYAGLAFAFALVLSSILEKQNYPIKNNAQVAAKYEYNAV